MGLLVLDSETVLWIFPYCFLFPNRNPTLYVGKEVGRLSQMRNTSIYSDPG